MNKIYQALAAKEPYETPQATCFRIQQRADMLVGFSIEANIQDPTLDDNPWDNIEDADASYFD